MRASFVVGTALVVSLSFFGTGCETIGSWFGIEPDVPNTPVLPGTVPSNVEVVPSDANIIEPDELASAQFGAAAFPETRTPDATAKFAPVYFGFDSAVLSPTEVSKIVEVGQFMLQNPTRALVIEGHCDERGSNEYNLSLSEQRALSVRKYLIDLGIDAMRVQTRPCGEEMPADAGHSEDAWGKNRRGEFVIFK